MTDETVSVTISNELAALAVAGERMVQMKAQLKEVRKEMVVLATQARADGFSWMEIATAARMSPQALMNAGVPTG